MKIRIFALAKDLGIENKQLIEYCLQAGVTVKSSALASITPEERDQVISFIENRKNSDPAPSASSAPTPTQDPSLSQSADKIRTIPSSMKRATPKSSSPEPSPEEASSEDAQQSETTVPVTVAEAEQVSVDSTEAADVQSLQGTEESISEGSSVQEEPISSQDSQATVEVIAANAETQQADTGEKTETSVTVTAEEGSEESSTTEGSTDDNSEAAEDSGSKEESGDEESSEPPRYVPPTGTSPPRKMVEMVPRANVTDRDKRANRRSKSKDKSALPAMAALPEFKAPKTKEKPKEEEAPAQRPDVKLTPDMIERQGPLSRHLEQHNKNRDAGSQDAGRKGRIRGRMQDQDDSRSQKRVRREKRGRQLLNDLLNEREHRSRRGPRKNKRTVKVELKTEAVIELPITVRSLSEAIGRPAKAIMGELFKLGEMCRINDPVEEETAIMVSLELGVDLDVKKGRDIEEELLERLDAADPEETLQTRPPIVTILGHVDHGKTSLLDKIRRANVADDEAGGITQHIASYQVIHNGEAITFVDTPGHAAFGEMRARGANVTDIVILVVAADDGVMPQTVECIAHAKASGVPILVALNKIDVPGFDEQKVYQGLATNEILPVAWGGEYEVVKTSAMTGEGIDNLLETILLTAELHEFKANPDRSAVGVCLEAFQSEGRGVIAWVIVQKGTLRVGDDVLCGPAFGRIRAMYNDQDEPINEAGPSTPVKVTGFDIVPGPGDHFFVMSDPEESRQVAEDRRHKDRTESLVRRRTSPVSIQDVLTKVKQGEVRELPLILKADTPGSLEALKGELNKFEHDEVQIRLIHDAVGGVNESDVTLASAAGAIIVAFHVIAEDQAETLAEKEGVEIRRFSIIYELTATIKRELEGLLEPEIREIPTGRALVLQTFSISRTGTIAGCRVLNGTISRTNRVNVIRDQRVLNSYKIASLRREKDDAKEVREGMECGIRLDGFNDVKEGDLLESYRIEEVSRSLDG